MKTSVGWRATGAAEVWTIAKVLEEGADQICHEKERVGQISGAMIVRKLQAAPAPLLDACRGELADPATGG